MNNMTPAELRKMANCVPFADADAGIVETMEAMRWAADEIERLTAAVRAEREAHDKTKHEFERVRLELKRWLGTISDAEPSETIHCWDLIALLDTAHRRQTQKAVAAEREKAGKALMRALGNWKTARSCFPSHSQTSQAVDTELLSALDAFLALTTDAGVTP